MNARFLLRVLALSMALGLSGCSKPSQPSPSGPHALPVPPLVSQVEPGQPGGRFVLANAPGLKSFNPLFTSEEVTRLLFGSLVIVDWVTQEPGPGLAASWSVSPDQKTWTFKLRQGLRWSDGQPLTARDVAFTWNRVMYNPTFNRPVMEVFRINGQNFSVTNLDDQTVVVVTPEVYAPFLEFFGTVPILPAHILEPAVRESRFPGAYGFKAPPARIVGSGPYRVKAVHPGKDILLERNPEYWITDRQGRRLPYFDEVTVLIAADGASEPALFLDGKADVFENVRPDLYELFKRAAAGGKSQLYDLPHGSERDFIWFNQNPGVNAAGQPLVPPAKLKWFRERKFRQAISCALDRERLAREVYGGRAQPAYGFISEENQKWNNPKVSRYAYDPARARALLADIGIQDRNGDGVAEDNEGNRLEIVFNSNRGNPIRENASRLIQENLRQIGIQLIYQPLEFRALLEKINVTFDYECALMGLGGGGGDPASQINVLKSTEELHQWHPFQKTPATEWEARIDALMEAQMRTLDFARRKELFDEVQAILAEELPMIYTVSPFASAAIRADVGNVRPSALTPFRLTWNLDELYFKKK